MKLRLLGILLLLFLLLIPAHALTRYGKKLIRPRESFLRFILYLIACLILVLLYTLLLVGIVVKLFPLRSFGCILSP